MTNHFRAELVTVESEEGGDGEVTRFPIRTNERQPPVEAVESDDRRNNVFSSRNFNMRLPEDFRHIVERKVEPIIRQSW